MLKDSNYKYIFLIPIALFIAFGFFVYYAYAQEVIMVEGGEMPIKESSFSIALPNESVRLPHGETLNIIKSAEINDTDKTIDQWKTQVLYLEKQLKERDVLLSQYAKNYDTCR